MDPSQSRSPGDVAPPSGAPWDAPIERAAFAFVDLEMTGLKVGLDRVVEICIERVRGNVVEARLETTVDPEGRQGAEDIHGLDVAALAGAPRFSAIANDVAKILEGAVFVAHGARWDLAFLADELTRVGMGAALSPHAIDTLVLCRRAMHLHGYGLQTVAQALSVPVERAHRAADDVRTMRAIWPTLIEALSPTTPRALWEVRVGERAARPEIVAAIEEALVIGANGQSVDVVYRPAKRGPERLTMVLTSLVSPYAIGYLLPGRGHRELRIDRILRIVPSGDAPSGDSTAAAISPAVATLAPPARPTDGHEAPKKQRRS